MVVFSGGGGFNMIQKPYDVIIVGAGMAGLTSAAYLSKEGYSVLLLEKDKSCGGLLGGFNFKGHIVDKGARGIIDSGIIFPMMRQLEIELEFLDNPVKMIVGNQSIDLKDASSIDEYAQMLTNVYPKNKADVEKILVDIKKIMGYMDVLYGIENPLFLPKPYDMKYLGKTLLPWMFKFIVNIRKAMRLLEPINDHLRKITNNEALVQIISQHFFEQTPTFFALSYFSLYLEYNYPRGSTQALVDKMVEVINENSGEILNEQEVMTINPTKKSLTTQQGLEASYKQLVWAADSKLLYKVLDFDAIESKVLLEAVQAKETLFKDKKGADSILTLYIFVNKPVDHFASIIGPHCFYTKESEGLSVVSIDEIREGFTFTSDKNKLFEWVERFIIYNTLEISIPALRDESLSPKGETSLIVSTLFDYSLVKHIADLGYYDSFKDFVKHIIINHLSNGLVPNLGGSIIDTLMATPITIEARTNNTDGSATGWSFANKPFPTEYQFLKVSKSVLTPIDSIKQAGQWTFNPAGVPVAALTGKLAADAVSKDLKKLK